LNINTTVDLPVAGNVVIVTIIQLIYFKSIGSGSPKTKSKSKDQRTEGGDPTPISKRTTKDVVHTTRKRTPEVYHRGADHPRSSYLRKHMNVYKGTTTVPTVATVDDWKRMYVHKK